MSETGGLVIGFAGLASFAGLAAAAMTDTLDDIVVWGLGAQTVAEFQHGALVVVAVVAVVGLARFTSGVRGAHGSTHAHGMAANGDGSCPRPLMLHERAHQRTCRRVGGGGSTIRTWRGGDGWWYGRTVFHDPGRVARLPVEKQIEIFAAGQRAAPSTSSPSDDAQIARLRRGMRTDR